MDDQWVAIRAAVESGLDDALDGCGLTMGTEDRDNVADTITDHVRAAGLVLPQRRRRRFWG